MTMSVSAVLYASIADVAAAQSIVAEPPPESLPDEQAVRVSAATAIAAPNRRRLTRGDVLLTVLTPSLTWHVEFLEEEVHLDDHRAECSVSATLPVDSQAEGA